MTFYTVPFIYNDTVIFTSYLKPQDILKELIKLIKLQKSSTTPHRNFFLQTCINVYFLKQSTNDLKNEVCTNMTLQALPCYTLRI